MSIAENSPVILSMPLPTGWAESTIAGMLGSDGLFRDGDWVESKEQDPTGDVRLIQLADIGDGEYRDRSARFLTSAKAAMLRCTFLSAGDILIARMPEPLGRACLFPGDEKPAVTVVDVCIVRMGKTGVDHRWLMQIINSPTVRTMIDILQAGTTRKRVSRGNLATLNLPIPPLAEQRRIVAAIEEQFTRLDAGVAALKRAQAALKRYRAAVLKAAVEGKLTEQWRAAHPDVEPASALLARILAERHARWEADLHAKGKDSAKSRHEEPQAPDTTGLFTLPEGWVWVSVEQISQAVRYGSSAKSSAISLGIPVLRMGNIQEGALDLSDLKYLPSDHPEFPELLLEPGDLLFNRTNSAELVGKSAVYRGEPNPCSFASYLIVVRLVHQYLPDFLCFVVNSPYGRTWIASVVSQQVGQANVNGTKLQAFAIPFPPLVEQEQIVAEVEQRLSVVSALETTITINLKRAERLRQAILQRAFSGRLVSQNPKDEPASALLERIWGEQGQGQHGGTDHKFTAVERQQTALQVGLWEGE